MESLLAAPLVGFRMLETTSSITSSAAKKSPIKSSVHRFRRSNLRRPQALKVSADYSCFEVKDVSYRPPGTQHNLLNDVSFSLREKSLGLIFGRSGSGKTTLLQLLAGLSKPTTGSINIQGYGEDGKPNQSPEQLPPERIGIVFQFPERYFLADTVLEEVTFGWPRQSGGSQLKEQLALGLQRAINAVGLNGISLDEDPHALSGGYKRRLALAVQLGCSTAVWDRGLRAQKQLPHAGVRLRTSDPPQSPHWRESGALVQAPDLLILDEPLAGLDWKARADVVKLLRYLKKELTLLVVSHDLKELSSLVDQSWRMEMGGLLREEAMQV